MHVTEEFVRTEEEAFKKEFGDRCFEGDYEDIATKLTESGFSLVNNELFFGGLPCGYNSDRTSDVLEGGGR